MVNQLFEYFSQKVYQTRGQIVKHSILPKKTKRYIDEFV